MNNQNQECYLQWLPNELMNYICMFAENFRDIVMFSSTCKMFYAAIWGNAPYNHLRAICLTDTMSRSRNSVMIRFLNNIEFGRKITQLCCTYPSYTLQIQQVFFPFITFQDFFKYACCFGNASLLDSLIKLNDSFFEGMSPDDMWEYFEHTCKQNNINSFKLMVDKCEGVIDKIKNDKWFSNICRTGNSDAIEYVINKFPEIQKDLSPSIIGNSLENVCANRSDNPEAIDMFLKYFPNADLTWNKGFCFTSAVYWGNYKCASTVLSKKSDIVKYISREELLSIFFETCHELNFEMVKIFVETAINNFNINESASLSEYKSDDPSTDPPFMHICKADIFGCRQEYPEEAQYKLLTYFLGKYPDICKQRYYITGIKHLCDNPMDTVYGKESIKFLIKNAPKDSLRTAAWSILKILLKNPENEELTNEVVAYFKQECIFDLNTDPHLYKFIVKSFRNACLKPNLQTIESIYQKHPIIAAGGVDKELLMSICTRQEGHTDIVLWMSQNFKKIFEDNLFDIFMRLCRMDLPKISVFLYNNFSKQLQKMIHRESLFDLLCTKGRYKIVFELIETSGETNIIDLFNINRLFESMVNNLSDLNNKQLDSIFKFIFEYKCAISQNIISKFSDLHKHQHFQFNRKNMINFRKLAHILSICFNIQLQM